MENRWFSDGSGNKIAFDRLPAQNAGNMFGITVIEGKQLTGLHYFPVSAAQQVLIIQPSAAGSTEQLAALLKSQYSPSDGIYFSNDGSNWSSTPLDGVAAWENAALIFLPGKGQDTTLEGFMNVIARLRAPGGCPWDQKQTHASLRAYLLEETYEALDGLDRNDLGALKEELGDLILQIALHAQIAHEKDEFNISDVLAGINQKIVFRHPHVFGDWVAENEKQVIQNWETLKGQEREADSSNGEKGLLDGVPATYPALAQAQALQERAARVGFDWKELAPVLDKITEELEEIRNAGTDEEKAKETGDLLFAVVNFIRWQKIDAETVLRQTNSKFRKRFAYIERAAKSTGKSVNQMTLEEMDALWEQAKQYDD